MDRRHQCNTHQQGGRALPVAILWGHLSSLEDKSTGFQAKSEGWREENQRQQNEGQMVGNYVPQTLITSPPASEYEPGLFTFVPLLRDVPPMSRPYQV